ncbi:MAG: hypothetical protein MUC30_02940 [Bacteroidales bacterium]|jgi:hypothetical protein|nr:hypothetical protein [Bacteroidales bacterium]
MKKSLSERFIRFGKTAVTASLLTVAVASCNHSPKEAKQGAKKNPGLSAPGTETVMRSADTAATTVKTGGAEQQKLKGRWMRSDGDYIIEVFETGGDGTLKAAYYNPNPINVEKGEWIIDQEKLFMQIILRDVNYPGSAYTLQYVPEDDALAGNYFQAVEGVNYDVVFTRKK